MLAMNAEQFAKDGVNNAADQFAAVADGIEGALSHTREQLHDLEKKALEAARCAARGADDFVHEKPWQAIGVAAALGLVAGLLFRRQ